MQQYGTVPAPTNHPPLYSQVLKGVDLDIEPGQTVAFVGPSGCGKSTLLQLALRFYDSTEGCLEVDGRNIKDYNVRALRESLGFVQQEPVLL